jgi:hypothetical protein
MNNRRSPLSIELLLYLVLLAITVWVRMARLDWLPLSDREAGHALTAVSSAGQPSPHVDADGPTHAVNHVVTVALFSLLGSSDAGARFASAIAGIGLVFTPLLLRRQIGPARALIACSLLAISPAAVTISREAGSIAPAALGFVTCLFLLHDHLESPQGAMLAGIALGVSLAAGSAVYTGLLGLAAGLMIHLIIRRDTRLGLGSQFRESGLDLSRVTRRVFITAAAALVILSSGFGFIPSGISAVFEALAIWLNGWTQSAIPAPAWILGLITYEPFLLIFGLVGSIVALVKGDQRRMALVSWVAGSLLVILIYPGRTMSDLTWIVVPLALLSSDIVLKGIEQVDSKFALVTGGFSLLFISLSTFSYIQLTSFAAGTVGIAGQLPLGRYLGLSFAGIALVAIGAVLMAAFFSVRLAVSAVFISGSLAVLALSISAGINLNFGATAWSAHELWRPQATSRGSQSMLHAYQAISQATTGRVDAMPVIMQGIPNFALSWIMRDVKPFASSEVALDPAPIILAPELLEGPFLQAEYLGQTMPISERWGWDGLLPPDLLTWYLFRDSPVIEERWILYARSDIAGLGESPVPQDSTGQE